MAGASPAPPRRDEALAIIVDRIVRTGTSPTIDEIGRTMRPPVRLSRAKELVRQLISRGVIEKVPGAQRAFIVRDVVLARQIIDQRALANGWVVAEPLGDLQQPDPRPQWRLPTLSAFRHLPED